MELSHRQVLPGAATTATGALIAARAAVTGTGRTLSPALCLPGPVITARRCTHGGRCIDVCGPDVFTLTHRFDSRRD